MEYEELTEKIVREIKMYTIFSTDIFSQLYRRNAVCTVAHSTGHKHMFVWRIKAGIITKLECVHTHIILYNYVCYVCCNFPVWPYFPARFVLFFIRRFASKCVWMNLAGGGSLFSLFHRSSWCRFDMSPHMTYFETDSGKRKTCFGCECVCVFVFSSSGHFCWGSLCPARFQLFRSNGCA